MASTTEILKQVQATVVAGHTAEQAALAAAVLASEKSTGGPVVPPAGNVPTTPALPQMPASSVTTTTVGFNLTGNVDGAGATAIQIDKPNWQALYNLGAKGVTLRRVRGKAARKDSPGIQFGADNGTCEDIDWLDDSGACFMVRGDGCTIRRSRARTIANYFAFVEGRDNTTIEDVTVEDWGADGIPNTADDDGGSTIESIIRAGNAKRIYLRRLRLMYRGSSRKACIRGDAIWDCEDGLCDGAITGPNPLNGGDGGRNWMLDRVLTNKIQMVSNPAETRAAVMAMKAKGEKDLTKLALEFRRVGRIWVDDNDHSKGEAPLSSVMNTSNHITQTYDRRVKDLAARSTATWRKWTFNFGYAVEHGSVHTMDANCVVRGAPENGGYAFTARLGEYPEPANGNDPGYQLPGDVMRPETRLFLNGTRVYGTGPTIVWGVADADAKRFIKGKFFYNDVLVDWS
jgi:hypothetical protein